MVGNYAVSSRLELEDQILTEGFYHRFLAAGAFRWGLIIKLTICAKGVARVQNKSTLRVEHYSDAWVAKTQSNPAATPFTHSGFETMYRRDRPFVEALTG